MKIVKLNWGRALFISTIAIIISTVNILHVIIGYAKTSPGWFYMATGHYYLDYFEYLQEIVAGMRGKWLATSYVSTDPTTPYFQSLPYIFIGKIAKLFFISPISAYWIAIFILTVILVILIYFAMTQLLPGKPLYIHISALLLSVFATPFINFNSFISKGIVDPYEIWYSPSSLNKRIGGVPYHILSSVVILGVLLMVAETVKKITNLTVKKIIERAVLASFLITIVLTFSPFNVLTAISAVFLTVFFYLIYHLWKKDKKTIINLIIFALPILLIVFPAGIGIKILYTKIFKNLSNVETQWINYPPISTVLLNIGPILIFVPFGIFTYFKKISPSKIIFLAFTCISYAFFYSKLAYYLGTHNLRFVSELNYVVFGALSILGIETIGGFFGRFKKFFIIFIVAILFSFFSLVNWQYLQAELNDYNLFSPITYLPQGVVNGFIYLDKTPDRKVVLTSPAQFLGIIVPIFADRFVYIGRSAVSGYPPKAALADLFYLGKMSDEEASNFLRQNNIGYVVLTSIEGYSVKDLVKYQFLKESFRDTDIVIYKVI